MGRKPSGDKGGLKRGAWCGEEDKVLTDYIKKHGEGNWRHVANKTGLERCGKSCRLRWLNYLRPDVKRGNMCPQEEDLIIRLHKLLGNRWSLIAGRLPGRTDNEVKNFWNTNVSKRVPAEGHRCGMNIINANDGDDQNQSSPVKPNDSEDHQVGVVQDTRNLNCTVAAALSADSDEKSSCFLRDLDNYIHGILQGAEINACENYVVDDDAYAGDQTARFERRTF